MSDLTGGAVTTGSMRVTLLGFEENVPAVPGTCVIDNFTTASPAIGGTAVAQIYGNDVIFPANTFYEIAILDQGGTIVFVANYQFSGTQVYDIASATPFNKVTVIVTPGTAILGEGQQQQFIASVQGSIITTVTWAVDGITGGNSTVGTISGNGLYVAPLSVGNHIITATAVASPSAAGSAAVTVNQSISVSVSPTNPTVLQVSQTQFTALVNPVGTSQSVTWLVDGIVSGNASVGTITINGLYLSPGANGSHTITAQSTADPTASGSTTVFVSGRNIVVTISPSSFIVGVSQPGIPFSKSLTATVSGATNTTVTWSCPVGSFDSTTNNTVTWTAPSTAGVYTITATANADGVTTGTSTATVKVAVSVSPSAPNISINTTKQFTGTVIGSPGSTAVTWSVIPGTNANLGSVNGSGLYSAPATTGTDVIVATSVYDPSSTGTTVASIIPSTTVQVTCNGGNQNAVVVNGTAQWVAQVFSGGVLAADQTVVWSVDGITGGNATVGTISSSGGLYTAPSSFGSHTITATSNTYSTSGNGTMYVYGSGLATTVTPSAITVIAGQQQTFSASVVQDPQPGTPVAWNVVGVGGSAVGSITGAGVFTAPASAGTNTIIATPLIANAAISAGSGSATATVTVVTVTVCPQTQDNSCPSNVSVTTSSTQQFVATVSGTADQSVVWYVDNVQGGNSTTGTINASGLYTAPSTPGQHTISAVSNTGNATGTYTVNVSSNNITVTVSPHTANVLDNGAQTFNATVTGTANTAVTWSVSAGSLGAGTIDVNGNYTAPGAGTGTNIVTATSQQDNTKSDSATVTVTVGITVSVAPPSASVTVSGTQVFTASVSGSTTGATFSATAGTFGTPNTTVSGGNSTTTATYTAPSTVGTFIVTAKSVADNTKQGTASVNVTAAANTGISNDFFGMDTLAFLSGSFPSGFPTKGKLTTARLWNVRGGGNSVWSTMGSQQAGGAFNYTKWAAVLDSMVQYFKGGTTSGGGNGSGYITKGLVTIEQKGAWNTNNTNSNGTWTTTFLNAWASFLGQFCVDYGTGGAKDATVATGNKTLDSVEIWNEPNQTASGVDQSGLSANVTSADKTLAAQNHIALCSTVIPSGFGTYTGKTVTSALRSAGFTVVGPSPQGGQGGSSDWLQFWLNAGGLSGNGGQGWVDVISRHKYGQTSGTGGTPPNNPEVIYTTFSNELAILPSTFAASKLWFTEGNATGSGLTIASGGQAFYAENIGIAFIQRLYLLLAFLGCGRVYFYNYDSSGANAGVPVLCTAASGLKDINANIAYPTTNSTGGQTVVANAWGNVVAFNSTAQTAADANGIKYTYSSLESQLVNATVSKLTKSGTNNSIYTLDIAYPTTANFPNGSSGTATWDSSTMTTQAAIPSFSPPFRTGTIPATFFGMNELNKSVIATNSYAVRFWDGICSNGLYPLAGSSCMTSLQTAVANAKANGQKVHLTVGDRSANGALKTDYQQMLTAITNNFSPGDLESFEVWNEANTVTSQTGQPPANCATYTILANQVLKAWDKNIKICSPSIVRAPNATINKDGAGNTLTNGWYHIADPADQSDNSANNPSNMSGYAFVNKYIAALKSQGSDPSIVDVWAGHSYGVPVSGYADTTSTNGCLANSAQAPCANGTMAETTVFTSMQLMRNYLNTVNNGSEKNKQLWWTEGLNLNVSKYSYGSSGTTDMNHAQAYIDRIYLMAWAGGFVDRVYFYGWDNGSQQTTSIPFSMFHGSLTQIGTDYTNTINPRLKTANVSRIVFTNNGSGIQYDGKWAVTWTDANNITRTSNWDTTVDWSSTNLPTNI